MTEIRENEIRKTIDELCDAMRAKDADRVAELHGPAASVFDMAPPLGKTFDREWLGWWFGSKQGDRMTFEVRDVTVRVAGALAAAYGLVGMGSEEHTLWHRMTWVLRESDGRWLIEHEHQSVPFYMDGSEKVALDLQP